MGWLRTACSCMPIVRDRLPVAGQAIRILEDVSGLRRRSLGLALGLSRSLLLSRRFIGLSLSLQNCGLLRRLSMNGLSRQLSMNLLLSWTRWARVMLRVLGLMLGPLQNLWGVLAWEPWHAWKLRLCMRNGLRIVREHGRLDRRHVLVKRRRCCLCWVLTHHGFDLVQAHHLPRRHRTLLLRLWLLSSRGRLRLEAPDVGTGFQLGDVVGIMVTLVAGPGGLRSVGDRRLLLLGRRVTSLVDHLLLLEGIGDHGRLAGEVEIPSDGLLGDWAAAKGVVIEGIVGLVELVAQAIVGFFKIDA